VERGADRGVGGATATCVSWEHFLRGTNKSLRIFALGLGVSVIGALIGVTGFWLEWPWLAVMG